MVVDPLAGDGAGAPVPMVIWMHGRTVDKETDPGRYLRWMRAGIGTCAIDLPGHGERFDAGLRAARAPEIVGPLLEEIDEVIEALHEVLDFDPARMGLGGMSLGGMAALARACRAHPFRCLSVEATTGSWCHGARPGATRADLDELDPIQHLDVWRTIPLQAIHARFDEWVSIEGQIAFLDALRQRYDDPTLIEFVEYGRTGAPHEHIGFGRMAADAKNLQRDFLRRWLAVGPGGP